MELQYLSLYVFVCLQNVTAGPLNSSWDLIEAERHHDAINVFILMRTWGDGERVPEVSHLNIEHIELLGTGHRWHRLGSCRENN